MELENLGGYTFMPYIVQGGVGLLAGVAADHLISTRKWRIGRLRSLLQVADMLGALNPKP